MKCRGTQRLLERYLDGELAPAQVAAVTSHLEACSGCRDCSRVLNTCNRKVHQRLNALPVALVAKEFDLRVLDAVLAHGHGSASLLDRLDSFFARPLYKLFATSLLGASGGALLVAAVLRSAGPGAQGQSTPASAITFVAPPLTIGSAESFYARGR